MSYSDPPPPPPPSGGVPPGGYGAPAYGSAAASGSNKKAIWSLVLGILGFCCCGIFAGIPAIFLSRSAKDEIAQTGQGGSGLATAGFVLGIISIIFTIISIILAATGNLNFDFSTSTT